MRSIVLHSLSCGLLLASFGCNSGPDAAPSEEQLKAMNADMEAQMQKMKGDLKKNPAAANNPMKGMPGMPKKP